MSRRLTFVCRTCSHGTWTDERRIPRCPSCADPMVQLDDLTGRCVAVIPLREGGEG